MNRSVGSYTNAELLSTYSDRILKAGGEKMSETEVDSSLDKLVELFSYLDDKDFFGEVFRNQLAKVRSDTRLWNRVTERILVVVVVLPVLLLSVFGCRFALPSSSLLSLRSVSSTRSLPPTTSRRP